MATIANSVSGGGVNGDSRLTMDDAMLAALQVVVAGVNPAADQIILKEPGPDNIIGLGDAVHSPESRSRQYSIAGGGLLSNRDVFNPRMR